MNTTTTFAAPRKEERYGGFFFHHGIWSLGVRMFRRMRFVTKALFITLCFVLPMVALTSYLLYSETHEIWEDKKDATRQHVEIAHGILAAAHAEETAGRLSREQAQAQALNTVKALRYENGEHFWVNDMAPKVLMHPTNPKLDGQDVSQLKDPNGFALFQGFVDTVRRNGQGFVEYQWPKPGSDKPVGKVSYVKGFEPWGWVIGTGIYTDDQERENLARIQLASGVFALALLLSGYFFHSFYKVMDGGLKETRRHLRAMTEGDLTTSPKPWGNDEAAQLMLELRTMQDALRQMVRKVRQSSDAIVGSSGEIAQGAGDLSQRTEQAAANLEETAAAMEQLAATVKQSVDHTREAAELARHNAQSATTGGQVMQNVVQTMDSIKASSQQIADIITTIDGIAFQTNILALNAAVEAARAGEQGRGFAVVAGEVRMLSQRSAEAAKEIRGLIVTSVQQVASGSNIVREAGNAIQGIVSSSQRVDAVLAQVALAADEQNKGIQQVGQSVQELDRMTQQNAALVEESAAAAESMNQQAHTLSQEVMRFKLPT